MVLRHSHGALKPIERIGGTHVRGPGGKELDLSGSLVHCGSATNVVFEGGTRGEVSRPHGVGPIGVWHRIISLEAPNNVLREFAAGMLRGIGVEKIHAMDGGVQVDVVDKFVHVLVPTACIGVLKVGTHGP